MDNQFNVIISLRVSNFMVNRIVTEGQKHVYVIDDDADVLRVLVSVISEAGYLVKSFSNVDDFLVMSNLDAPAVMVLDMRMPTMTGVELQRLLLERNVRIPVVFVSGESSVEQGIHAFKQGAIDFLIKPFNIYDLYAALKKGIAIDQENIKSLNRRRSLNQLLIELSPRERQVFDLLALGFNNKELMAELKVSLPTIKQYKTSVMQKLNLSSLSELISLNTID